MKLFLCFLIFLTISVLTFSQTLELKWAEQIGGTNAVQARKMIADISGNTYSLVSFSGTADFDPGSSTINFTGTGTDFAVVKLSSNGDLVWVKQFGGSGFDVAQGISRDNAGNICVSGMFNGTCDFDPGIGTSTLTAISSFDGFFMKLNSSGDLQWVKQLQGTTGNNEAKSIDIDGVGNIIVHGQFQNTMDFDPGPGTFNLTASSTDLYILKVDPSGNLIWCKNFGGSGSEGARCIGVDNNDDIYCTSLFNGTVDFDPGAATFNLTASGPFDICVFKITSAGNFGWAGLLTGSTWEQVYDLTVDALNNVWIAGNFNDVVDFDPSPASYNLTSASAAIGNGFILKLTSAGTFSRAIKIDCSAESIIQGITIDNSGNIYMTGYFRGTIDFDPGAGTQNVTCIGNQAWFILKLNPAGNYIWGGGTGGTLFSQGVSIAVDASDYVYTSGYFYGTIDFNPEVDQSKTLTSVGVADMFITKFGRSTLPVSFLSFEGRTLNDNIKLSWSTASEINNNYFTLERSVDGEDFIELATIEGHGNTSEISYYNFIDYFVSDNLIYYRLSQTDYDGRSEVLSIIAVKGNGLKERFRVFADPSSNEIEIYSSELFEGPLSINILDPHGRILFSEIISNDRILGTYLVKYDFPARGVYFVSLHHMKDQFCQAIINITE